MKKFPSYWQKKSCKKKKKKGSDGSDLDFPAKI